MDALHFRELMSELSKEIQDDTKDSQSLLGRHNEKEALASSAHA